MRHYSRKKKSPVKILFALTLILAGLFVASKQFFQNNKTLSDEVVVAQYGEENIYKSDIERKINALFEVSSINKPLVPFEALTDDIVQILSKEIYLDRKIVRKAEEAGIAADKKIANRLESYKTAIIRQLYIDSTIVVNEKEVQELYNQKYINQQPKKEYRFSQIVSANKAQSEKIRKMLKGNNFNELYKKYSIQKVGIEKNGDMGYISEDFILNSVKTVISNMKIGEVSKPISLGSEWTIVKLLDKIEPKIPSLEEVKSDLEAELKKKKYDEIANSITDSATFRLILRPKPDQAAIVQPVEQEPSSDESKEIGNVEDKAEETKASID